MSTFCSIGNSDGPCCSSCVWTLAMYMSHYHPCIRTIVSSHLLNHKNETINEALYKNTADIITNEVINIKYINENNKQSV